MKKIIACRGVPASGKTTWAMNEVENNGAVRFNKDDIRTELQWLNNGNGKAFENIVIETERKGVEDYCKMGIGYIIIDNTHLKYKDGTENKHISFYRDLAKKYNYEFEVKEFYVSKEEAILRDKIRGLEGKTSVGERVINRFFKNMKTPTKYPGNPTFKELEGNTRAIIVDIDGTLAFMDNKRSPYDYNSVMGDRFNERLNTMINLIRHGDKNIKVIIVTGRKAECLDVTKEWLKYNKFNYDRIYCRHTEDNRCDSIVKEEIYNNHIKDKYDVLAVFDDRNRVVDKWRELGLPTYQVWYGDF